MSAHLLSSALNGIWQGMLLAALVALAMRLVPRGNAAATCALWTATYFLIAALPLIDFFSATPPRAAAGMNAPGPSGSAAGSPLVSGPERLGRAIAPVAVRFARGALALWFAIALVLVLRLIRSYRTILSLKRGARSLTLARDAVDLNRGRRSALVRSAAVPIPCAIGFAHPMIVLPPALVEELEPTDLARVIAHERAHLERYDDWLDAAERLIGAVLFFHPALRYVARRIRLDREVACDDRVVETLGEPLGYARCLTRVLEYVARGPRILSTPGFFGAGSQVAARVDRLLDPGRDASPGSARRAAVVAAALVLGAFALSRVQVPVGVAAADGGAPAAHGGPAHVDLLDALADGVSARPTVDDLIALRDHGVSGDFVVAMSALLPAKPTVAELVELADHGVCPEFVHELAGFGYTRLSPERLIALADAGVGAHLIERLRDHGYRNLTVAQLIDLANSGFSS